MDEDTDTSLPPVTSGTFFVVPPPLPRGRHDLSRGQVLATHREQIMIAATELLAAHGLEGVGIREICSRAAISRAAFYECFPDKMACIFAAYDRFTDTSASRLLETLARDSGSGATEAERAVVAYLGLLQQDLVTARAFLLEIDTFGKEARRRRRDTLRQLALLLQRQRDPETLGDPRVLGRYLAGIYAVRQTAADALDTSAHPDLVALTAELLPGIEEMLGTPQRR